MAVPKGSGVDKRWLVENRSKIQMRMLELYELHKFEHDHDLNKDVWPIYGVLIGAVFSLWRAVFLIRGERDPNVEIEHGRILLGTLIETNAIGFPQDVAAAQWTAGYYVNNAALRLSALVSMPSADNVVTGDTSQWLEHNLSPFDVDMMNLVEQDLKVQWEKALKGFDLVFGDLKSWLKGQE